MTQVDLVECPLCGVSMAMHEDAPDTVAGPDVGFYVSHPLWVPYPTVTECRMHEAAGVLAKRATADECAQAWTRVADVVRREGADGIFMSQLLGDPAPTPSGPRYMAFDQSPSMTPPETPPAMVAKLRALLEGRGVSAPAQEGLGSFPPHGGTSIEAIISDTIGRVLDRGPVMRIVFTDGEPDGGDEPG